MRERVRVRVRACVCVCAHYYVLLLLSVCCLSVHCAPRFLRGLSYRLAFPTLLYLYLYEFSISGVPLIEGFTRSEFFFLVRFFLFLVSFSSRESHQND